MSGEKPTVPENLMSTLTLSDYNSVHTLSFTNIRYTLHAVTTLEHLEPV